MTTTATSTLASDPQRAWQTVLGQLQMEMPRASYDTWVRDTKALSYKEGHLTIGVRNAYARDWLESRLQSTVSRLLIGIMNCTVDVEFVVNQLFISKLKAYRNLKYWTKQLFNINYLSKQV